MSSLLSQEDFADFLEERASDVVEPSGAELLEIATQFYLIRKAVFGSAIRLQSGEFQFEYSNDNQKGSIEVPEEITIGISPFHNGKAYKIKARLRYRLREGVLTFSYRLVDPEKVVEDAFKEMVTTVEKAKLDMSLFEAII